MIKNIFKTVLIVLVLVCGLFFFSLSSQIGGWRGFVVSSASMEPTLPVGSLVLTQAIPSSQLKPQDIITFIQPTKEKEFITHRITKIVQKDKPISFKTKGDNNPNDDAWTLAGGGVVGKVMFSIPYLGFMLSFSQTKLGIILFILIPAFWILYDEILSIIKLFRKPREVQTLSTETQAMLLGLLTGLSAFFVTPTHALLESSAQIEDNYFSVVLMPTATPAPTSACGGNTSVTISGNGTDSHNTVSVTNNCTTVINQTNTSQYINTIHIDTNKENTSYETYIERR